MIVASVAAADTERALAAARGCAGLAGLIEYRLDRIGSPDPNALVAGSPVPVIAACPLASEGGAFAGSREERRRLLLAAASAGARFVDVDVRSASEFGSLPGGTRLIASSHDAEGTPARIAPFAFEALASTGGLPKLVTTARCAEDGLRLLQALRDWGGKGVAFAMGEAGRPSRLLAPLFGSAWTYAAADGGAPTAPGQWSVGETVAAYPPGGPSPSTVVVGVVGRPIAHSISPVVHRAALRAAGFDAMYLAFEPARLSDFLALLDDRRFTGLSVTAPFKVDAARVAVGRSPEAEASGAANTLVRHEGGWIAHDTDGDAAADAIEATGVRALTGSRVLVAGAGGAARSIAAACLRRGASVAISGRSKSRVDEAARTVGVEVVPWGETARTPYDVLVQATPLGRDPADSSPFERSAFRAGTVAVETVYASGETAFLRLAREGGARWIPGVEMFWRQAEAQFRLFTGTEPAPGLMRAASLAALRPGA